jgi:hypothetical protein
LKKYRFVHVQEKRNFRLGKNIALLPPPLKVIWSVPH